MIRYLIDVKKTRARDMSRIILRLAVTPRVRKIVGSVQNPEIRVFEMLSESTHLRDRLAENTRYFREKMEQAGFEILPGEHLARRVGRRVDLFLL